MNRIQPSTNQRPTADASTAAVIDSAVYSSTRGACCHSLFAPLHYEAGYAYPLLVWLHGPRDDENQLRRIMPEVSMRNYVAVAPRGTLAAHSDDCEADGDSCGYDWVQSEDHILLAQQRIFDGIDHARERYRIHPERIFLAGFDCGGTMAFRVAMAHPRYFAGILSLGGPFPTGMAPLRHLNAARRLPVLMAGGRFGERYGDRRVAADLRLLHSAGMSVTLRLYPCGDELSPQILADVDRWIMQQVCPNEAQTS
jgi:phospholipase/carboxylesterase